MQIWSSRKAGGSYYKQNTDVEDRMESTHTKERGCNKAMQTDIDMIVDGNGDRNKDSLRQNNDLVFEAKDALMERPRENAEGHKKCQQLLNTCMKRQNWSTHTPREERVLKICKLIKIA
jgi:ATP-dependent Zn protease